MELDSLDLKKQTNKHVGSLTCFGFSEECTKDWWEKEREQVSHDIELKDNFVHRLVKVKLHKESSMWYKEKWFCPTYDLAEYFKILQS